MFWDMVQNLKKRLVSTTVWTVIGYVASQVIRLAGNLLLTRLLFPEAFGIMAIVNTFIQGLHMFSDVGINVGVVQSKRGDDPEFLHTAWTIQVLRGFVLFSAASLIAFPVASFYNLPILIKLLPFAGATALIEGFNSMKLSLLQRHMKAARLNLLEIGSQLAGLLITCLIVYYHRSVWSLVYGNIGSALIRMALSHFILAGYRDRFAFHKSAWSELVHFGKWIFLGTALTFVVMHGDRLALAKAFTLEELAIYSIAFFFSQAPVMGMLAISQRVLLPLYAEFKRNEDTEMVEKVRRIRRALLSLALPCVCILIMIAKPLIVFLYDPRYHGAGWMLEVLAYGALASVVNATISPMLLAAGDSFRHLIYMCIRAFILFACMAVGYYLNGAHGVIVGLALTHYLTYPFIIILVKQHGVWCPRIDGVAIGASLSCLALYAAI